MIQPSTTRFLRSLAKNNNKTWFDKNRETYLSAKSDFENMVSAIIQNTGKFDADINELAIKNCTFRINRDIRFSKDKTPYKVNMGASFNRGGKKSIFAGYYFHLEPGGKSFCGGGLWMPSPADLKNIRQEIDYGFDEFRNIILNKKFISQFGELQNTSDIKLVNIPKGYDKLNVAVEYLKLKSILALKPLADSVILSPHLLKQVTQSFEALMPLVKFMNRSLE
ncbi:MAG: DUF2461 domain-containing protein [Chitinophagaceae bacterium]|nr:DUF2461 domain-containing protein [Chitinophagaceae bacterium]